MPIQDPKKLNSLRADLVLVERGLARSRSHASELIKAGKVSVAGKVLRKPSDLVELGAKLNVEPNEEYVSRAALKLKGALSNFVGVEVFDKTVLDVGASTGGFTQVLLSGGAKLVVAVDVGHDQLASQLRADPRVISLEGVNARSLTLEDLRKRTQIPNLNFDLVVGDLSFISLTLVIPSLAKLAPAANFVLLIKPQFEVGKHSLSASGVVSDPKLRAQAIRQVVDCANDSGLRVLGLERSELAGTHGNIEYLIWISSSKSQNRPIWTGNIEELAREKK